MLMTVNLVLGTTMLILGAELLVSCTSKIARFFAISPLTIGLTIVAFGTSAPELFVSSVASLKGNGAIAIANVVGSNTFNVCFILGSAALIAPLQTTLKLIRVDAPIMLILSIGCFALLADGKLSTLESWVLVFGLFGYTAWTIRAGKGSELQNNLPSSDKSEKNQKPKLPSNIFGTLTGLVLLIFGSKFFVESASTIAKHFKISDAVIGVTLVAAGTSLPEVATSLVAALRGQRDIAIGNVIGSNIFNILGVLGISGVVAKGIAVPETLLSFDIPVMIVAAILCLPILITGLLIDRLEGALLILLYICYVTHLVLTVKGNNMTGTASQMVLFGVPLILYIILLSWQLASN